MQAARSAFSRVDPRPSRKTNPRGVWNMPSQMCMGGLLSLRVGPFGPLPAEPDAEAPEGRERERYDEPH